MAKMRRRRAGRESAATRTLKRIERDAALAPSALKKALEVIGASFFEPSFTVDEIFDQLETPRYQLVATFRALLHAHPAKYITLARLEMAGELLLTTNRPLQEVAIAAGFKSERLLIRSCHRFFRLTPGEVRERAQKARQVGLEPRFSLEGAQLWEKGDLDRDLVEEIEARLDSCDRDLGLPLPRANPIMTLHEADEEQLRFQLMPLMQMPRAERLGLLRRGAFVGSRKVLEILDRWSREEIRNDRRRGLEWAEVALAIVEGTVEGFGREKADLMIIGWARLANARRLASDFESSERALLRAQHWLPRARKPSAVRAELACYQGSLRLYQRRFPEAAELFAEAILLSRQTGNTALEVGALQQRANLRWYQGDAAAGIPDLYIALERTPEDDLRSRLISTQLLLLAHVVLEDHDEIAQLLPLARDLSTQVDDQPAALQVRWAEALHHRARGDLRHAELLLQEARAGFAKLRDPGMRAVVSLDLALLSEERARPADVFEYASEALPALEALGLPEAIEAHHLLWRVLTERKIRRQVLEKARSCLLFAGGKGDQTPS